MGQRLTIYDFSKIMNAPDDLKIWNLSRSTIDIDYEQVFFRWEWQGYSGYGEIFLYKGVIDMDKDRCRESVINISSDSKKQADKSYSPLYNEKGLIVLFDYILSNFCR